MKTFEEYMQGKKTNSEGKPRLWSAKKSEILGWWSQLKPDQPIMPEPIPSNRDGSTYGFDGIRITGSREFIASVMSRFKDFAYQETPSTKLELAFRQVEDKYSPGDSRFVFYAHTEQRSPKKIKAPKIEL
jgi:hypothetical protein